MMSFAPAKAMACAACFGQSDSAMARGFNWGIFSLLAVVVMVLGTIAGFFVYLARRAAAFQPSATGANPGLNAASGSGPVPAPSH
jgi:ascorbate-specific PTS system EIIC-type component UlaA